MNLNENKNLEIKIQLLIFRELMIDMVKTTNDRERKTKTIL
jgi:hypothetical protein